MDFCSCFIGFFQSVLHVWEVVDLCEATGEHVTFLNKKQISHLPPNADRPSFYLLTFWWNAAEISAAAAAATKQKMWKEFSLIFLKLWKKNDI